MYTTKIDQQIATMIRARYPFIYVHSFEESRVVEAIDRINNSFSRHRSLYIWSQASGMRFYGQEIFPSKPKVLNNPALDALYQISQIKEDSIFVLCDFHHYMRSSDNNNSYETVRLMRDLLPQLKNGSVSKTIIIVSPTLVIPDEMQKEISIISYPLPGENELVASMNTLIRDNDLKDVLTPAEKAELANVALGMTMEEAENAFSRSIIESRCRQLNMDAMPIIFEEKKQVISKSGLLDYIDKQVDIQEVGGLEVLKNWLKKRCGAWNPGVISQYHLPLPKGVLVTGVPGCGKSMTAKAMSAMWGLPLVKFDFGRVFSGLVGSSEENMRRAIATAEAMAPCILWIDEIEKGLSGGPGSTDGGTSARVLGTFLSWMQEKTSMVFIVATANDIHALKPELLRKGRFDEIFFVDLPNFNERSEIFKLHIEKRQCDALKELRPDTAFYHRMAAQTDGFSGAEIESVVISALFEAYAENRTLLENDFHNAIKNTVPLSVTQEDKISALRNWAQHRAVYASVPDKESSAERVFGRRLSQ